MVKFESLFINFMIAGLVIFSLLAFVVTFQDENSAEDKVVDNELIRQTYSVLEENLSSFSGSSQEQKSLFEEENPTSGFGTILLFSIVSAGRVFNAMVISVFDTLIKLPVVFLGIDPVVVSVISTILVILIILGLWTLYKLGG